jgi:hypothetical protein
MSSAHRGHVFNRCPIASDVGTSNIASPPQKARAMRVDYVRNLSLRLAGGVPHGGFPERVAQNY